MKALIATDREHIEIIRRITKDCNVEIITTLQNVYNNTANIPKFDVGISYMFLEKVRPFLLGKPWINFHPGPLPEYKGRNLCYHAIMDGAKEFGATVHYMDETFDTGPIIEVQRFPIYRWDTAESLHEIVMGLCLGLFMDYFPRIMAGAIPEAKIENVGGRYFNKEEIDDFIYVDENVKKTIRAITFKEHKPKIRIGGQIYEVVKK